MRARFGGGDLLDRSAEAINARDWREASDLARQAVKKGQTGAYYNLALALDRLGSRNQSNKALRRAAHAGDPKGRLLFAQYLWSTGRRSRAFRLLTSLPVASSRDFSVLLARWDWVMHGRLSLAELLVDADPADRVDAAVEYAGILCQQGRGGAAEAELAFAASHGNCDAWLPLGNLLWSRGDTPGALAAFEQGMLMGDSYSAFNAGLLLADMGAIGASGRYMRLAAAGGDRKAVRYLASSRGRSRPRRYGS